LELENIDSLNHLVRILRGLSLEDAGFILSELAEDHRFEPARLEYLGSRVFFPESLLTELSNEHLILLYKFLGLETCVYLYQNHPNMQASLQLAIPSIQKKTVEPLNEEFVLKKVQESLALLVGERKIAYNGKSLLFFPPTCRKRDANPSSKVQLEVLNPFVPMGWGIEILVNAPEYAGRYLRVSFQANKERFFRSDSWFHTISLDDRGYFLGEIRPQATKGIVSLIVEFPSSGEIRRTIFFTSEFKTLYLTNFTALEVSERFYSGKLSIEGKHKTNLPKQIKLHIYCETCGAPLHFGLGFLEEESYRFRIPVTDPKLEHSHRFIVAVHIGDQRTTTILNTKLVKGKENIYFRPRGLGDEETLVFEEKSILQKGNTYLYFLTNNRNATIETARSYLSESECLETKNEGNYGRALSPLELSMGAEDWNLLYPYREKIDKAFYENYTSRDFSIIKNLKGFEKVDSLYLVILEKQKDWKYFLGFDLKRESENRISPEIPMLAKGEEREIFIFYNLISPTTLIIHSPRPEKHVLQGRGKVRYYIRSGETLRLEWQDTKGFPVERTYHPKEKTWNVTEIKLYPNIQEREKATEIYSIQNMLLFLSDMLVNYKWLCGEQIAARIVGLCYLSMKLDQEILAGLTHRIETGIYALNNYKSPEGFYGIFSREEANLSTTRVIYSHLELCKTYKPVLGKYVPLLFEIIKNLEGKIGKDVETSENKDFLFRSIEEEKRFLTDAFKYVERKDDNLLIYKASAFYSQASIFLILLGLLYIHGKDSLMISKSRKRKEEILYRKGIIGLLEKWGFLVPEKTSKLKHNLMNLENARETLMKNILFRFIENSFPSTVELSTIWRFCIGILKQEKENETIHFVRNTFPLDLDRVTQNKVFQLEKQGFEKGEYIYLKYDKVKLMDKVVHLHIPALIQPSENSSLLFQDGKISFYPRFLKTDFIEFRAEYKGIGRLFAILEDPYDPSDFSVEVIGNIKVQSSR
jgi:hypothetical protein